MLCIEIYITIYKILAKSTSVIQGFCCRRKLKHALVGLQIHIETESFPALICGTVVLEQNMFSPFNFKSGRPFTEKVLIKFASYMLQDLPIILPDIFEKILT